jgi:hypothetical protein
MQDQLQKAINLAKKTGDKLIVFDSAKPENIFVVMAVKDYENLVLGKSEVRGLTEDELLDKINRDIAIWKSELDEKTDFGNFTELPSDNENRQEIRERIRKAGKSWTIPSKRKLNAEEIVDDENDGNEEDRQYLEELEF